MVELSFYVFIGTVFLIVCLLRQMNHHLTKKHHFGFEAAAWYWHFVDVVWLFLFVAIYWWGGAKRGPNTRYLDEEGAPELPFAKFLSRASLTRCARMFCSSSQKSGRPGFVQISERPFLYYFLNTGCN